MSNTESDQAVIITVPLNQSSAVDANEIEKCEELLEQLQEQIGGNGEVDGNEFGSGKCTFYIYGSSAENIYCVIESLVKNKCPRGTKVMLRYGEPGAESRIIDL